ncbi:hypothetical protein [Nitratireductor indicus]|uniref:hypothetical protein n=1 Tax=Nitratireductor indicus TaxID=721133 RepID=UPI0028767738|nr:hypothetical protein [Nitratireductor indicus]MDS1138602.1 hypothetical protein [Nitratireductor indicus]
MSRHAYRRRWGDNDRHFGPLTYAYDARYRPFSVVLSSAEEEYPGCNLRLSAFGRTVIVELPEIIKPHVSWVDLSDREWAKQMPDGRKGYTQVDRRAYGFSISDGFLQVFCGRLTMDSDTDRTKGYFLPWTQWRHVRRSFYGLNGEHVATLPDTGKSYLGDPGRFQREQEIADATPTVAFEFDDFDGERITAITRIEEREWHRGDGRFKWLSWFYQPKIDRSLDIRFSAETGKRKGSWKGGTIGHSISTLPGELHESAFRRYCAENQMTFIGGIS